MCWQQLHLVGRKKTAAQLPLAPVAILALSVLWKAQEMLSVSASGRVGGNCLGIGHRKAMDAEDESY